MSDELVPLPSPGVPLVYGEAGDPAVIVLHDWYGRLPWLEKYGEALASRRLRVLIPDLYDGVATIDERQAERMLSELDRGSAAAEIDDAISGARGEGSPRIGLIGFAMGGRLALLHAQTGSADAVAAYYSLLEPEEHGIIPTPVQLHYAEVDDLPPGEPEAFISRLKEHGTPVARHDYTGTVHGFANASIREHVNANAAALAFARTAVFLEGHLHD